MQSYIVGIIFPQKMQETPIIFRQDVASPKLVPTVSFTIAKGPIDAYIILQMNEILPS